MENIIDRIKEENLEFLSVDKLATALAGGDKQAKTRFYTEINKRISEGTLVLNGSSVMLPATASVVRGKLIGNQRGFAFCKVEDDIDMPDVFIPNHALNTGLHKDTVLVRIVNKSGKDDLGAEGEVVRVLNRNSDNIVGTFQTNKNTAFVVPDDRHYFRDIFVKNPKKTKAKDGDKVVVRVADYSASHRSPQGELVEVLGSAEKRGVDILSIIREHNLYEEFPEEVEAAALKVPQRINPLDYKNRTDFTNDRVVTIDGEDARDLDDAISIVAHKGGGFTLSVHIADVAQYVTAGSLLDKEAFKRGTSVYFPDRVLPMLPRPLSNGICSLNPNEFRLVLSVVMELNSKGEVTAHKICEGIIKSKHRMTYTDVFAILEGNKETISKYGDYETDFKNMEKLHNLLFNLRKKRGSLDFDLPEAYIHLNEAGKVVDITQYPRNTAHRIIESFMVLANEVVALDMLERAIPFVYRVHERPDSIKMTDFFAFLAGFGIKVDGTPDNVTPKKLQKLLEEIEPQPYADVINKVMLRSLQKARYAPTCLGHFGLAATHYCHFTSPIRRYPDLVSHRMIKACVINKASQKQIEAYIDFVVEASIMSSQREKLAEAAERDVDDLKKAEYMQDKVGAEFDAVISGVTEFGVFVELDNTVEGMARIEKLPKDNYFLEPKQYTLRGARHSYQLGKAVRVKCLGANLFSKKVDFEILE